jgi:hypothetical protein
MHWLTREADKANERVASHHQLTQEPVLGMLQHPLCERAITHRSGIGLRYQAQLTQAVLGVQGQKPLVRTGASTCTVLDVSAQGALDLVLSPLSQERPVAARMLQAAKAHLLARCRHLGSLGRLSSKTLGPAVAGNACSFVDVPLAAIALPGAYHALWQRLVRDDEPGRPRASLMTDQLSRFVHVAIV